MNSTAYSRPSKLPGGAGDRRPPTRLRGFASKIEPKKLGAGLLAGCCLALLTYVSLAKLFAIYSPVFASTANTSGLLQNAPPASSSSSSSVPETTDAIPAEDTTFIGRENDNAVDPVNFPEEGPAVAGSQDQEPGVPEVLSRKEDEAEKAAAAAATTTSVPKPSSEGAAGGEGAAKLSCDENGVDEGFPYARPSVCELSGDIRISPKQKTMYLVNPSGAGGFDENGEKRLRPYARKDDFLLPAVVEVTVKSVPSPAAAPQCTKKHRVPAVVFSVAGYTDNFFHDNTDALIPLFLTASHLKGEVQLLITNYKPWWVQKYTPVLRKLSNYDPINFDADAGVHCFSAGYLGLYRDRDLIISPHPTRNPRNYTMVDYNRFIRSAYALRRDRPSVLGEVPGMRPQILIISRGGTRKLLNLEEVVAAAEELGFNVTVAEAGADVPVFTALVNAADVGRSRSRSSSGSSTARTSAPASTTPPLPSPPSRTSSSPGGRKSSHIALKVIFKSQLKQSQVEHQLRRQNTRSIPAVATMASASAAAQVVSFPPGRRAPLQPPRCTHSERGVSFDPGSAFYRSDSAPGRDLAVLAATLHRPRLPDPSAPFLCLDAMCGSGVRALRYLAQAGADFVWANDASDALHPVIVGNLPRLEPVPHLHRLAVHERLRRKMDCPIRATTYSACSFVDEVGRDRAHWWR